MAQVSENRREVRPLKVDCSFEEHVREASLVLGPDGGVFECTVGGMTKQAVSMLDDAIYAHVPVQLLFAGSSLVLDLESLESNEPHTVRIVGRVIGEPPRPRLQ